MRERMGTWEVSLFSPKGVIKSGLLRLQKAWSRGYGALDPCISPRADTDPTPDSGLCLQVSDWVTWERDQASQGFLLQTGGRGCAEDPLKNSALEKTDVGSHSFRCLYGPSRRSEEGKKQNSKSITTKESKEKGTVHLTRSWG